MKLSELKSQNNQTVKMSQLVNMTSAQKLEYNDSLTKGRSNPLISHHQTKRQEREINKIYNTVGYEKDKGKSGYEQYIQDTTIGVSKPVIQEANDPAAAAGIALGNLITGKKQPTQYKEKVYMAHTPNNDWTDEQKYRFGYLYTQDKDKANEFAKQVNEAIEYTKSQKQTQKFDEKYKNLKDYESTKAYLEGDIYKKAEEYGAISQEERAYLRNKKLNFSSIEQLEKELASLNPEEIESQYFAYSQNKNLAQGGNKQVKDNFQENKELENKMAEINILKTAISTRKAEEEFNSKYGNIEIPEDFKPTIEKKDGGYHKNIIYNEINGFPAREDTVSFIIVTRNGALAKNLDYVAHMKDDEKKLYNWLEKNKGIEAANKYFDDLINYALDKRKNEEIIKQTSEFASQNAATGVIGTLASVPISLASGFEYAGNVISGNADKRSGLASATQGLRQGTKSLWEYSKGKDAWDFLYDTGASGLDSLAAFGLNAATGGTVGTLALSGSAAANTANDLIDRGANNAQIIFGSISAGLAEYVFESLSLEQLKAFKGENIAKVLAEKGGKGVALEIAKSIATNASEEFNTELANIIVDDILMGSLSNYKTSVFEYYQEGMTLENAKKKAAQDLGEQVALAAGSGALMGLAFGGVGSVAGTIKANYTAKTIGNNITQYKNGVTDLQILADSVPNLSKTIVEKINALDSKSSAVEVGLLANAVNVQVAENAQAQLTSALEKTDLSKREIEATVNQMIGVAVEYAATGTTEGKLSNRIALLSNNENTGAIFKDFFNNGMYGGKDVQTLSKLSYKQATGKNHINYQPTQENANLGEIEDGAILQGTSAFESDNNGTLSPEADKGFTVFKPTQALKNKLEKVASKFGLTIEYFNGNPDTVGNGSYTKGSKVIRLNENSKKPTAIVFSHELVHYLVQDKLYSRLQNILFKKGKNGNYTVKSAALKNWIKQKQLYSLDIALERYAEKYKTEYAQDEKFNAKIEEELIADFLADTLFGRNVDVEGNDITDQFATELFKEDKTLFEKIKEWFANVIAQFKDVDDVQQDLKRIAKKLQKMQENLAKKETSTEKGEVRKSINASFEAEIDAWVQNEQPNNETFILGTTGDVLQGLGAIESDIYMLSEKINEILNKHPKMTIKEIKKIPQILENPILILKSQNDNIKINSRLVVFGNIKTEQGDPVLSVLDLRPIENNLTIEDMQKVTSSYIKDFNPIDFIKGSQVVFADKNKTTKLLRTIGFQTPIALQQSGYIGNISYKGPVVNIEGKKFNEVFIEKTETRKSLTVDSEGNTLTEAQQEYFQDSKVRDDKGNLMVVYHGTDAEFNVFEQDKTGLGYWFTENQSYANQFGKNIKKLYLNVTNPLDIDTEDGDNTLAKVKKDLFGENANESYLFSNVVKEELKRLGYDGIMWEHSGRKTIIAFNSNQAKLTTNENPTESDDIRYSKDIDITTMPDSELQEAVENEEITKAQAEEELMRRYGKIPNSFKPKENIVLTAEETQKEDFATSEFINNVLRNGKFDAGMTEEQKAEIIKAITEHKQHKVITDENTIKKVQALVENDYQKAVWEWLNYTNQKNVPLGKEELALGQQLLQHAAENGNAADTVKYLAELTEAATRAGQAVQSFSLLKKMGGIGRLYYVNRTLAAINRDIKKRFGDSKKAKLVELDSDYALLLANAKTQAEIDAVLPDIFQNIAEQIPKTIPDIWNTWRYLSMLGNPRTHARNVLGNALFTGVRFLKDFVAATIQSPMKTENKTRVFITDAKYRKFASEYFEKHKNDILQHGRRDDLAYYLQNSRKPFGNRGIAKPFNAVTNINFDLLEWEDNLFKRINFVHSMAQYLQAKKIDLDNISEEQLNEVQKRATKEALEATFQDDNIAATLLTKLSRGTKYGQPLIEGVFPFKRTPTNIIKQGVYYSPLGFVRAIKQSFFDLRQGKITADELIDSYASALTGTGLFVLGVLLAGSGVAVGSLDPDDEEDKKDKMNGVQEYSIKIGNYTYTVDWLAPASIPFFMGVELQKAFSPEEEQGFFETIANITTKSLDPLINLSMLSGFNNLLDAIKWNDGSNILGLGLESLASFVLQGTPTLFGQIARTFDDTRRITYVDKNKLTPDFVQEFIQKIQGKIPGWENEKTPYINAWGETESTGSNVASRAAQNFISPGYVSSVKDDPITKELIEIYLDTDKDGSVLPQTPSKSFTVNGQNKYLTSDEYVTYATESGKAKRKYLEEAFNNGAFDGLSAEQKANVVKNLYSYAEANAKTTISDYQLSNTFTKVKNLETIGVSPVTFYIASALSSIENADTDNSESVTKKEKKQAIQGGGIDSSTANKILNYKSKDFD